MRFFSPPPPLSLSPFYSYVKLLQATQKGKRSKEGFEVTPQRYFGILQYATRHNHSFSLKQVIHAVFGSLFKAQHKQDLQLVNRKTYSLKPFLPPLMKKSQKKK